MRGGATTGIRTRDLILTKEALYLLSYRGMPWGWLPYVGKGSQPLSVGFAITDESMKGIGPDQDSPRSHHVGVNG